MTEVAPEARLWDILRGALATRALGLAADLRVADALAAGPRPVEDIEHEVGADADTLLSAAGFEPVSLEEGLIEARCR